MKTKTPVQSLTINTEVVLPNDTNHVGNLFGGKLMQWVDITAAIAAQRHCGRVVVTAAINHVSFDHPIKQNSVVTLEAKVSRAFKSSMEVFVDVFLEKMEIIQQMFAEESTTQKEILVEEPDSYYVNSFKFNSFARRIILCASCIPVHFINLILIP